MGLTYRGQHSERDIGVLTTVQSRPVTPPVKTNYDEDIPYMDGSIDFSEAGGRRYYKDKILEVDFKLISPRELERNRTIEKFVSWLNGGKGDLILDDMPLVKWIATPITMDDMTVSLKRMGSVTVEFRCEPFNKFIVNTINGICLDDNIPLDSEMPIGWGDGYEVTLVSGANEFTIINDGTVYVRPVIQFDGSFTSINITAPGGELSYSGTTTQFMIDCAKFACFSGDKDVTGIIEGEFPELAPGDNEIKINCAGSGKVLFDFEPQFYYDALL